jgi:hypothetical protein
LAPQHQRQHGHHDRSRYVDDTPARELSDDARRGARKQDAQEQSAHHGAHDATTLVVERKRRRHRHEELSCNRAESDERSEGDQATDVWCESRSHETYPAEQQHDGNELATRDNVPDRH